MVARDDLNRSDPRSHIHRPDPRHDSHRPDPRRHDRRTDHRGTEGTWTGHTQVLHQPVTERLALHEPATERLVHSDLAVLATRRLAEQAVEVEAEGLVAPPGDNEVYSYFGAQMRWVQVLLLAASVLAGWSLLQFALASVKILWPMLIVLGLNLIGTVLSSLTSFNTRRVSAKTHRALVEGWAPSGPAPSIDVFLPTY
jgi:cellulose synthase (UDP-forming)